MLWVTRTIVVAGALPQPKQLEVEPLPGQRVEGAERLVEQEHLGLERECARERHALGRAARELGRACGVTAGSRATSSVSVGEAFARAARAASRPARAGR